MPSVRPKFAWFAAFTAVYAAAAAFVFWGTWSLDVVPVMPDCRWNYPSDAFAYVGERLGWWLANGKFVPGDLKVFLGSPWFWQELQYALAGYFAALGVAYWCRGRGMSRLAGYGAGLLLAFCGYWFSLYSAGHLGWFEWMTYGVFAFGLADRAVRRGKLKNWVLLGACVGWGGINQPDLWLMFTLFTGAYFLWCCARERRVPWKGALVAGVTCLVVGGAIFRDAFVNALSGRESQIAGAAGGGTAKGGGPADRKAADEARWIFVTNWSLPPEESVEFVKAGANGDTSCPLTLALGRRNGSGVTPYTGALGRPYGADSGNYRQHSLYVGWVTCLLALAGLARALSGRRAPALPNRREILFFAAAAAVFWLFALGRYCAPVYRLVYMMPFGDSMRCPVKWHHLTELCVAFVAAFGLDGLVRWAAGRVRRPWALAIPAFVVLFGTADLARVSRRYLAPVDMTEARKQDASMEMTFLRADDFRHPQVAELVRRRRIVPLAYHPQSRDVYVVGVLSPRRPGTPSPVPPANAMAVALGALSLVGSLGAAAAGVAGSRRAARCLS